MPKCLSDNLQRSTLSGLPRALCSSQVMNPEIFDLRALQQHPPSVFQIDDMAGGPMTWKYPRIAFDAPFKPVPQNLFSLEGYGHRIWFSFWIRNRPPSIVERNIGPPHGENVGLPSTGPKGKIDKVAQVRGGL